MDLDLSRLSVAEIRRHFLNQGDSAPPGLLARLQRDPREGVRRLYRQLKNRREKEKSERTRIESMLNLEWVLWKSGIRHIAGADEVGVGPLAGPVVAAAVVFPPGIFISRVDDSKRLSPQVRREVVHTIRQKALGIGVGLAEVAEIDELNVYHAGLLAMRRAVENLPLRPDHLLVDAREIPGLSMPQNKFSKGGRPQLFHGSSIDCGQDLPGPTDGRARAGLSPIWIGSKQGVRYPRAPGGDPPAWPLCHPSQILHLHSRALRRVLRFVLRVTG